MKVELTIDEVQVLLVSLHAQEYVEEKSLQAWTASHAQKVEMQKALADIASARRKLRDAKTEYEAAILSPVVKET